MRRWAVAVSLIFSFSTFAFDFVSIEKPSECHLALDDDREIGGDEFWRFTIDFESKSIFGVKKETFNFAVDSNLERLTWSSTWRSGQSGRLDIREDSLFYKRPNASEEAYLIPSQSRASSMRVLRELRIYVHKVSTKVSNPDEAELLKCFKALTGEYIEFVRDL